MRWVIINNENSINNQYKLKRGVMMYPLKKLSLAAVMLFATWGSHVQAAEMSAEDLVTQIKKGGYVIYIRHASTEKDYADQVTAEVNNCSTQRVLSEKGWREAKEIGNAFKRLDVPVGKVISSEYCRAWKTADLAFSKYEKSAKLNFEKAENYTAEQTATMKNNVAPMLSQKPQNKNTVIVAHDDPFEAATGIYPDPMGVTYIIEPMGEKGFKIVGHIGPNDWPKS